MHQDRSILCGCGGDFDRCPQNRAVSAGHSLSLFSLVCLFPWCFSCCEIPWVFFAYFLFYFPRILRVCKVRKILGVFELLLGVFKKTKEKKDRVLLEKKTRRKSATKCTKCTILRRRMQYSRLFRRVLEGAPPEGATTLLHFSKCSRPFIQKRHKHPCSPQELQPRRGHPVKHRLIYFERGEKTPTPKISALLRERTRITLGHI